MSFPFVLDNMIGNYSLLSRLAAPLLLRRESSSAARTNLTSQNVKFHGNQMLGQGTYLNAYAGTYLGGNRNQQEAVCKTFKRKYAKFETEFFASNLKTAAKAVEFAQDWNQICPPKKQILITYGSLHSINGKKYLVEPLIRYFEKFLSNNGWIASQEDAGWPVLAMEAFSHYTYHRSGGQMIVCDLQGRYRNDAFSKKRCRFELTDPTICSRGRDYGVTDMGEKGIDSFFHHHRCNKFCNRHWQRPVQTHKWFTHSSGTFMMSSETSHLLRRDNPATFNHQLQPVYSITVPTYDWADDDD